MELLGEITQLNLGAKGVEIEKRSEFASLVTECGLEYSLIFCWFLLLKHLKILKLMKDSPMGF